MSRARCNLPGTAQEDVASLTPAQVGVMLSATVWRLGLFTFGFFVMLGLRAESWHVDEVKRRSNLETLAEQIIRQTERHRTSRHLRRRTKLLSEHDVDPVFLARETAKADAAAIGEAGAAGAVTPLPPAISPPTPWSSALKPEEWMIMQGVLRGDEPNEGGEDLIQAVEAALAEQLGRPWLGFAALSPTRRALAAAFCCYYGFDRNTGEKLLGDLATLFSLAPEIPDTRGEPVVDMDAAILAEEGLPARIDAILAAKPAQTIEPFLIAGHAFEETAFLELIMKSRSTSEDLMTEFAAVDSQNTYSGRGLLPPAQFVWLKEVDRPLWYVLDTAGSNTPPIEAAGVFAHYLAETSFTIPLDIPCVRQAARAIVEDYFDLLQERVEKKRKKRASQSSLGEIFSADTLKREEASNSQGRP